MTPTHKPLLQRVDLPAIDYDIAETRRGLAGVRIPESMLEQLEAKADELRTSLTSLVISKLAAAVPGCLVLPRIGGNQPKRSARLREELAAERGRESRVEGREPE